MISLCAIKKHEGEYLVYEAAKQRMKNAGRCYCTVLQVLCLTKCSVCTASEGHVVGFFGDGEA